MVKIVEIEGIGPTYAQKLIKTGITTAEQLLEAGATPAAREHLSTQTGISETLLLEWINHADLMRINGVGPEYADLLEEAGVDTVVELARRNPENLHTAIISVNDSKQLVRRPPRLNQVTSWINQAKEKADIQFYSFTPDVKKMERKVDY